ncbi:MAG: HAD family phosphatase [Deltaproteobacteria bacterium]|nr:HAD family phosphatase [Deltaproteobacteria bacterium]
MKSLSVSNTRGVIFDFDGVIVDSEPFWNSADRIVVEQEGKEFIPDVKNIVMGLAPAASVAEICRFHKILTAPKKILKKRENLMKKFYESVIELNCGAYEILEYLYLRKVKIALASSTPKRLFEKALKRFRIDRFFDVIVTSDDIEKSKPDPEIFFRARKLLGLPSSELIIVEDSRAGVEAAIAAGIKVFWLRTASVDLKGLHPDYIINSLTDLMLYFER